MHVDAGAEQKEFEKGLLLSMPDSIMLRGRPKKACVTAQRKQDNVDADAREEGQVCRGERSGGRGGVGGVVPPGQGL